MPTAVDLLRLANVALALVLVLLVTASAVWADTWDQRGRFLTLGGYGVVTVGGQIDALGRPPSWPLVLLFVVTASAVLHSAAFVIKVRKGSGGRGDARPAGDQLGVPGRRAAPRRPRHLPGGTHPPQGGTRP